MLTIRHVEVSGHTTIMEVVRVTEQPILETRKAEHGEGIRSGKPEDDMFDYGKRELFYEDERGNTHNIQSGTVFVMNGNGQTVSRHFFGEDGRGNVFPKAA